MELRLTLFEERVHGQLLLVRRLDRTRLGERLDHLHRTMELTTARQARPRGSERADRQRAVHALVYTSHVLQTYAAMNGEGSARVDGVERVDMARVSRPLGRSIEAVEGDEAGPGEDDLGGASCRRPRSIGSQSRRTTR